MSFSIRNIRELPSDPLAKFTNELSKKLSRFLTKDQLDLLDDREDIYTDGQDFDSVIKYHADLLGQTQFTFEAPYYPPFEPDGTSMRVWVRGVNLGNQMTDWSLNHEDILLFGDPIIVDGAPHDDGIKTSGVKSIALRLNRPTSPYVNDEYIQVEDGGLFDISGASVGKSYFMRFRTFSLAQQDGYNRTLFEKIDGPAVQDAVVATITTDGRLTFGVIRSGVTYSKQTAASTISTDTVYDVWFTFDQPTKAIHIYVNAIDKSLTDTSLPTLQSDTTNSDLWIGQRGKGPEAGFLYGDVYDFRLMDELVVTQAQAENHYANKWTIADIPFGQVMIANYWATYPDSPSAGSFTATSFTSTSFTT